MAIASTLAAVGTYIPARVAEFIVHLTTVYDWLRTWPVLKLIINSFLQVHSLLDHGEKQMKKAIYVYLFITYATEWTRYILRLVTFEFINEEDKVVAEKKVIVGWNLLHEEGAGSTTAASPSRRRAASPSPRLTLKQDIKAFQQQVRAGGASGQLPTTVVILALSRPLACITPLQCRVRVLPSHPSHNKPHSPPHPPTPPLPLRRQNQALPHHGVHLHD